MILHIMHSTKQTALLTGLLTETDTLLLLDDGINFVNDDLFHSAIPCRVVTLDEDNHAKQIETTTVELIDICEWVRLVSECSHSITWV